MFPCSRVIGTWNPLSSVYRDVCASNVNISSTEDERIKEDLEMTLHIKTENDKMINKIMKTIREECDILFSRDFPSGR
jgi:hypothetical protein